MADRMLRFARDPELAATMGEVGKSHMKDNYSSEKSLGQLRSTLIEAAREND